jgi:hypothetical protein
MPLRVWTAGHEGRHHLFGDVGGRYLEVGGQGQHLSELAFDPFGRPQLVRQLAGLFLVLGGGGPK